MNQADTLTNHYRKTLWKSLSKTIFKKIFCFFINYLTFVCLFYAVSSGPPTDIKSDLLDEMQLTFSWDPPICGSRKGEITKYEYTFGLENGDPAYGSIDHTTEQ